MAEVEDQEVAQGAEPLVYMLSKDVPPPSPNAGYFYSALAAFETRTAYANISGDMLGEQLATATARSEPI